MSIQQLKATLPAAFDSHIYRALHPDLQRLTDEKLQRHYGEHGINEGRRAHSLADRVAFAALARGVEALELNPSYAPLLSDGKVRYFDTMDRAGLVQRAERLGKAADGVPERVHFVSPTFDLSVVDRKFDVVLSSHLAQRQPDLVRHLNDVERLLHPGGLYLLCVPDQRYCFAHFLAPSTVADVLDAHHSKRLVHSLRSQIEGAALTTHNDPTAHWAGQHGAPGNVAQRTVEAVRRYQAHPEQAVDVPAWYFTPTTFQQIVMVLHDLGHTGLTISRLYPSLRNSNEFWAILEAKAD